MLTLVPQQFDSCLEGSPRHHSPKFQWSHGYRHPRCQWYFEAAGVRLLRFLALWASNIFALACPVFWTATFWFVQYQFVSLADRCSGLYLPHFFLSNFSLEKVKCSDFSLRYILCTVLLRTLCQGYPIPSAGGGCRLHRRSILVWMFHCLKWLG